MRRRSRCGDPEHQSHPVLQAAAVLVLAMIGERREKLVQQVAVGRVDLDHAEAGRQGAAARGLEGGDDAVDPGLVERHRDRVAFGERDRAGPDDRPAPFLGRLQAGATLPRHVAARLAAGVGELDAGDGPLAVHEPGDPRQRLDVAVVPDPQVAGRDPPLAA